MANELLRQTLENRSSEDPVEDEDELENLELQLKQMAQTILHYRSTVPDQFKKTFASFLVAQRPIALPLLDPVPSPHTDEHGTNGDRNPDVGDNVEASKGTLLAEEDPETAEKIRLLKLRISSNVSAIPILLKRMKDCMSMMEEIDSYKPNIHPAFKRKRTR